MRIVTGDLHGNVKGLIQCLERSNFDLEKDELIQLGDIVDGFPDTFDCVEILKRVKNLILIRGNHDDWFITWLQTGLHPDKWRQGAYSTANSYLRQIGKSDMIQANGDGYITALNPADVPPSHERFFRKQVNYYIDDENNLFVHGGFNRHANFSPQPEYIYYWDRDLWGSAMSFNAMKSEYKKFKMKTEFKEIFIGHTSTTNWAEVETTTKSGIIITQETPVTKPMHAFNIWNCDTGGGSPKGKVTFMNIETKEIFQSDLGKDLYPGHTPR
jgi:serine/threonine protein phosphatase 1